MFEGLSREDVISLVNNKVDEYNIFLYVIKHNSIADTFNSNISRSTDSILESISEGILIFTKNYILLMIFKYNEKAQLMEKDVIMGYSDISEFKVKKFFNKVIISWIFNKVKYSYEFDIKNPGVYYFNVSNYYKLTENNWKV